MVDLTLRFAQNLERDRFAELGTGLTVQCGEDLPIQLEFHCHQQSFRFSMKLESRSAVARNMLDSRMPEK